MRGVTPNGVTLPRGAISVICMPGASRSLLRQPRADDDGVVALERGERAGRRASSTTIVMRSQVARRGCRAPGRRARRRSRVAITWPSTTGAARVTPGTARTCVSDLRRNPAAPAARPGPSCGPCRPRMRDSRSWRNPFITAMTMIERCDAERDADQRQDRDDRDEPLLPRRPQIAQPRASTRTARTAAWRSHASGRDFQLEPSGLDRFHRDIDRGRASRAQRGAELCARQFACA